MYCGEFMRAFIHIVIFAALITAADHSDFFGLMAAFWWFYMLFDSYQIAKAKQEGRPVQDVFGFMTSSGLGRSSATSATAPTEPATATPPLLDVNRSQNIPLGPIVLIGLGILFLLHTMGGPDFFPMGKLWPLILVGIGGWLIWQRTQKAACHCVACTAICLMGPAILVTIGVIGMLHEFTPIRWWRSWPLILIVVGVLKFLQITGSREGHIGPGGVPPAGPPPDASSTSPQQNEVSHG
jgi:cell wall-active antibiotic response 4TMS protein YvqF